MKLIDIFFRRVRDPASTVRAARRISEILSGFNGYGGEVECKSPRYEHEFMEVSSFDLQRTI